MLLAWTLTARHLSCKSKSTLAFLIGWRRSDTKDSGLGIGTTPAALIKHGIDTTIVEIDPVVHKLATQYFDLPSNHVAAIEDATKFVKRAQKSPSSHQYDYIIHDVFTGGAEPAELFTLEFLRDLSSLLKDDGVIAIVSYDL